MAHCLDALAGEHILGKLIVYESESGARECELYTDGGDHWNVYTPTRQQAAVLVRTWRRYGLRVERTDQ
jgi:hypothetical protein